MNIVICGGGTAGWLAALMISSIQKDSHSITVIESSKIGIVGAGEGSTGQLGMIIRNDGFDFGCNEREFMEQTDATAKVGIIHKDWYQKGTSYKAPLGGTTTSLSRCDTMLRMALIKGVPTHLSCIGGAVMEGGKSNFWEASPGVLRNNEIHGYHFDARKVGHYFKNISLKKGVKHIDCEIVDVIVDSDGINSLTLADGRSIESDFYIDCTGFARKLMSALGVGWTSYRKHLPVNTALTFFDDYQENEIVHAATIAWAQSSGWIWKIPTAERYGCGYVFDDKFISEDQALAEAEQSFGHKLTPNQTIKFDTGRLDKLWHKNCMALGLCAAFAEPLEATSIHSTIVQIYKFAFGYLHKTKHETINSGSQFLYNKQMTKMYDDFRDFLVMHYQTQRTDSEFWKWINTGETRTELVQNLLELCKTTIPTHQHFDAYFGAVGDSLWNWILAGLHHINGNVAANELNNLGIDIKSADLQFEREFQNNMIATFPLLRNNYFTRSPK